MAAVKEELLKKKKVINKLLQGNGVVLSYLFGSQATSKTTVLSDVDIAVLFSQKVRREEYGDRQKKLIGDFIGVLERNDVDVVILNVAPSLVRYEAIGGYLFYCRSNRERVDFQVQAVRDYMETKEIRRVQWEAFKKRIAQETNGKSRYIRRPASGAQ